MSADIERLSRNRIRIVTCLALSYLFFQAISLSFVSELTGWSETSLNWLENIGLVLFLVMVVCLAFLAKKAFNMGETAIEALFDELVKHNAYKAMQFGYKILFLLATLLFILNQDFVRRSFAMEAEDVARIMITAALVVPYLRFAYLEAQHAQSS